MKPKIISEKALYTSALSKIILAKLKFPNGKEVEWDYFENKDVVGVLPIDKDGNVYLVKEWRPAWKDYLVQIPAGHCLANTESGRLKQAHNELREETGMDARNIKKIASFANSSRMKYKINLYLAQDLFTSYKNPDEHEYIEVIKMPFKKAYKMFAEDSKLTTSTTIIALLKAKILLFD